MKPLVVELVEMLLRKREKVETDAQWLAGTLRPMGVLLVYEGTIGFTFVGMIDGVETDACYTHHECESLKIEKCKGGWRLS